MNTSQKVLNKRRILVLSSWLPYPPDNGSKIKSLNTLRRLAAQFDVFLVAFTHGEDDRQVAALRRYCREVKVTPVIEYNPWSARALVGLFASTPRSIPATYNREFAALVKDQLSRHRFDLVICESLGVTPYIAGYQGRKLINQHNVESDFNLNECRAAKGSLARLWKLSAYKKSWSFEKKMVHGFDACTVVSEDDAAKMTKMCPGLPLSIIPSGLDLNEYKYVSVNRDPATLIYNGSLTYSANEDAVRYLLTEIYPHIKKYVPSARVLVTGRYSSSAHSDWHDGKHVVLTGYVDDVKTIVATSTICVVPLRIGAGTRLKIVEAMALGTPIVATSTAVKGLPVKSGDEVLIADDPAEFAESTIELLTNANLRTRLATRARQLVEQRYDWDVIGRDFLQVVNRLVEA